MRFLNRCYFFTNLEKHERLLKLLFIKTGSTDARDNFEKRKNGKFSTKSKICPSTNDVGPRENNCSHGTTGLTQLGFRRKTSEKLFQSNN